MESRGEIREAGSPVPASHFIHILRISFWSLLFHLVLNSPSPLLSAVSTATDNLIS